MLAAHFALLAAALFAGAAIYVSVAEHPARLALDDEAGLRQWRPSYARGKVMQGLLALAGSALALWVWWHSLNQLWLIGALLLLANWPFTLAVIMPVNRKLEAAAPGAAGPETRTLLRRWGRLHAVRSALGAAAALVMLCALHCRV
jgi:anthrone oxygenase-like protein